MPRGVACGNRFIKPQPASLVRISSSSLGRGNRSLRPRGLISQEHRASASLATQPDIYKLFNRASRGCFTHHNVSESFLILVLPTVGSPSIGRILEILMFPLK